MIPYYLQIQIELQIEKYKKFVDSRGQFDKLDIASRDEYQERDYVKYNMNTDRILTGILIGICFGILVMLIRFAKSSDNLYIVRLVGSNIGTFILLIFIPLIIIVRNEKFYAFFKNKIYKTFKLSTICKNCQQPVDA